MPIDKSLTVKLQVDQPSKLLRLFIHRISLFLFIQFNWFTIDSYREIRLIGIAVDLSDERKSKIVKRKKELFFFRGQFRLMTRSRFLFDFVFHFVAFCLFQLDRIRFDSFFQLCVVVS